MGRPVMLGNGSLTVGINEQGLVHDFYYPYVGLENLTTSRSVHHKIGVWVENAFSWVDDGSWDVSVNFEDEALVSVIRMQHKTLQIELIFNDFVDAHTNVFCRRIYVTNQASRQREIRLFMHQVFEISRAGRADTALYVPAENYILDYKGRCCLLISGRKDSGDTYDQFAVGSYGIEGKEGTFRDAEDGVLSGSPVEHGGVDSVLRFVFLLDEKASEGLSYWIAAADSQLNAERLHNQIIQDGLDVRLTSTRTYWTEWLSVGANQLHTINRGYIKTVKKSLMIIKAHVDKRGGIIASCDSSIYNYGRDYYSYVWPRDAAYALWPLIRLGYTEEARKFFEFCRDILTPEGYLMHKYQPDRAIGSTWHPLIHDQRKELAIQEDETALILFMLGEFFDYSHDADFIHSLYGTFIQPAANFLSSFVDKQTGLPHASYDLWEEKFQTSLYTTAVVHRALLVAADFADKEQYPDDALAWRDTAETLAKNAEVFINRDNMTFRKGFLLKKDGALEFDNTIDLSSLYAAMIFGLPMSHEDIQKCSDNTIYRLLNSAPIGGAPRYEFDHYFESNPAFLGNPWLVTTLWIGQYYIRKRNPESARELLDWTLLRTATSGAMSEQVHPISGMAVSVTPLVWSHAEFVNTALDLARVSPESIST